MTIRKTAILPLLLLAIIAASGCNGNAAPRTRRSAATIPAVIKANPDLSIFSELLELAQIDAALAGPGPYTVFAPTDEAFAALPAADLQALRSPQNRPFLHEILTYHIVPAAVPASEFKEPSARITLQGESLYIATIADIVIINDGAVLTSDIRAANGFIHTIDTVLTTTPDIDW